MNYLILQFQHAGQTLQSLIELVEGDNPQEIAQKTMKLLPEAENITITVIEAQGSENFLKTLQQITDESEPKPKTDLTMQIIGLVEEGLVEARFKDQCQDAFSLLMLDPSELSLVEFKLSETGEARADDISARIGFDPRL